MMNKKVLEISRSYLVLLVIIFLVTILSVVIYTEFIKTKDSIFQILKEYIVDEKIYDFRNLANTLNEEYDQKFANTILSNKTAEDELSEHLTLLHKKNVKYLYILYKDLDGKFRYLADATTVEEERAFLNQKFDAESDIWEQVYKTKHYAITQQHSLDSLWVTMVYPIVIDQKVVAVIGADFTYDVYQEIIKILTPMEDLFLYISFFMLIMLILAYILLYLYSRMRKKAYIDPLTKIYNRQYLPDFLGTHSLEEYLLIMIDLDNFKLINDNFGHDTGDEVLVHVVNIVESNIRHGDVFIRFGGEEFLLFIKKEEKSNYRNVAERIRQEVQEYTVITRKNRLNVTVSMGVNPFPHKAKHIEEAIKIADQQLYIAKTSGRNRIEIFDETKEYQKNATHRISDIKEAIDDDRIKCAYQPIFQANGKDIEKYEMLLRMLDKDGNVVPPNSFLPSIRHTQVYINLTAIILQNAIETLEKYPNVQLTVNMDIQDIVNQDIIALFINRFKEYSEVASRITVEVLEHEEIKDFKSIHSSLMILKELGLLIALDDFGSGYSNFKYIINLEIDILKIDGSLIRNIHKDTAAYNIVKAIIEFGKSMGMTIVAEQIETKEEYDTVVGLGVDLFQGYYLGKPTFSI